MDRDIYGLYCCGGCDGDGDKVAEVGKEEIKKNLFMFLRAITSVEE